MARKLEAQFDGQYLMSSVLMTSTMKSEPGTPGTRASSRGVPVSAAATFIDGRRADGARGAGVDVSAVAAPAATTPLRNPRRSTCGPEVLRAMAISFDELFGCLSSGTT